MTMVIPGLIAVAILVVGYWLWKWAATWRIDVGPRASDLIVEPKRAKVPYDLPRAWAKANWRWDADEDL